MKLLYPGDWTVQPLPGRTDKVYLKMPNEELHEACVQITFNKLPQGASIDALVKMSSMMFAERYPNATVESIPRSKVAGRELHILLVHFGPQEKRYTQKMVYFFKEGHSYSFAYAAMDDRFSRYEAAFDQVVRDFELKGDPNQASDSDAVNRARKR